MFEMHSADIKELAKALALVQGEMKIAEKKKNNPFFKSKYADFQSVVEASRPALVKNNLSVSQLITEKDNGSYLVTMLMHNSGQYLSSVKKITPIKEDIQSYSSYVTYCKRIAYSALVGVVCAEEDDDGENAMTHQRYNGRPVTGEEKVTPDLSNARPVTGEERVTPDQLEQLWFELEDEQELTKSILKAFRIKELRDLPKNKFLGVISRIREVKSNKKT